MIKTAMEKLVIVGAGMTGASSAALLRKILPEGAVVKILDKSRGTGGRMSTSRCSKGKSATVDLGAQYISINLHYAKLHKSIHQELISKGLLQPSTCVIEGDKFGGDDIAQYVAPDGISSVVKYFVEQSGAEVGFDEQVAKVDIEDAKVKLTTLKGNEEVCDGVLLTMPVPQILQLDGSIRNLINSQPKVKENLENVSYSMRFAVGLFYNPGVTLSYPWAVKYFRDNPCVCYIAIDNKKRGKDSDSVGPSAVIHTSVRFGMNHLEEDKEAVKDIIMKHVKELLPDLPEPAEVKGHKWRYSQVHKSYADEPGCIVLSQNPPIILAGDAFSHSNLDGCLDSAQSVRDAFVKCTDLPSNRL
ncbi:renalase-like [Mizuhopecten yessoensis]|uniref:Renalase n=1 Tax=Mizuhopecten yessoensis TaxID=6573 RepID=A0A210Q0G6_MIZYE|nr:renalase-like [Mizuhopecten yessoensis]OWF42205.1 Renalase [Mizuhopecten yessoensis]